jgi:ABC-type proline/glycine betaine transport system permease subunit
MQFFVYEIVARIVAIYFCVDCFRTLRSGLIERKIKWVNTSTDILDWLLDWAPRPVFHRDTAPVRYWMEMGTQTVALLGLLFVAVFGWWQPNP